MPYLGTCLRNVSSAAVVIGALRIKFHFHEFQPTTCPMDSHTMPYRNARLPSSMSIYGRNLSRDRVVFGENACVRLVI